MSRLWEESKEGQGLLSESPFSRVLLNSLVTLMEGIEFELLQPHLIMLRVVTPEQLASIKDTNSNKVYHLVLSILHRGPVWQFHAFLRSLALIDRPDLITNMGLDSDLYTDFPIKSSSLFDCPVCRSPLRQPSILPSCQHYICQSCIRNASSSSGHENSITCPVRNCQTTSVFREKDPLPSDKHLESLYKILGEAPFKKDYCKVCSDPISLQKPLHSCKTCQGNLCTKCYILHKDNKKIKKHETVHNHHEKICCLHGKPSEQFCKQCGIYCCVLCLSGDCEHHRTVTLDQAPGRNHRSASALRALLNDQQAAAGEQAKLCQNFRNCFSLKDTQTEKIQVDASLLDHMIHLVNLTGARARRWEELNDHLLSIIHRPEMREETLVAINDVMADLDFSLPEGHQLLVNSYNQGFIHRLRVNTVSTQTEPPEQMHQDSQTNEVESKPVSTQTQPNPWSDQASQTNSTSMASDPSASESSDDDAPNKSKGKLLSLPVVTSDGPTILHTSGKFSSLPVVTSDGPTILQTYESDLKSQMPTKGREDRSIYTKEKAEKSDTTRESVSSGYVSSSTDSTRDSDYSGSISTCREKTRPQTSARSSSPGYVSAVQASTLGAGRSESFSRRKPAGVSDSSREGGSTESISASKRRFANGKNGAHCDHGSNREKENSMPSTSGLSAQQIGLLNNYASFPSARMMGFMRNPSMRSYGEEEALVVTEPKTETGMTAKTPSPKPGNIIREVKLGKRGNRHQISWLNTTSLLMVGNNLDMFSFTRDYSSHKVTTFTQYPGPYRHVTTTPDGSWMACKPNTDHVILYNANTQQIERWQPQGVPNLWLVTTTEDKIVVTSSDNTNIYVYGPDRRFMYSKKICLSSGNLSPSDVKCFNGVVVLSLWNHEKVYVTTLEKTSPIIILEKPDGEAFGRSLSVAILPMMHILVADKKNRRLCIFNERGDHIYTENLADEIWDFDALYFDVNPMSDEPHVMAVSAWSPEMVKLFICELGY